jgi:hypothetical protein
MPTFELQLVGRGGSTFGARIKPLALLGFLDQELDQWGIRCQERENGGVRSWESVNWPWSGVD